MKQRQLGFSPGRLTLARELRGWTQRELAVQSGHSDASVSQYESGARTPQDMTVIQGLAAVLGQPVEFFTLRDPPVVTDLVFYRSRRAPERHARLKALAYLTLTWETVDFLQQYASLPPVNLPKVGQFPDDPFEITSSMIQAAAVASRQHWNMADRPAPNIVWLLEAAGVVVSSIDLGTEKLDSLSVWRSAEPRPYIILNPTKRNAFRARFDVAHELGHLLLHQFVPQRTFDDPAAFNLMEAQATEFAEAFLLPAESFLKDLHILSLESFIGLKPKWKVTVAFMLERILHLNIITPDKYSNYRKYLAGKKWLSYEPLDAETPPEKPMMMQEFLDFLSAHQLQTPDQILQGLGVQSEVLEKITQAAPGFFTSRPTNIKFTPKQKVG